MVNRPLSKIRDFHRQSCCKLEVLKKKKEKDKQKKRFLSYLEKLCETHTHLNIEKWQLWRSLGRYQLKTTSRWGQMNVRYSSGLLLRYISFRRVKVIQSSSGICWQRILAEKRFINIIEKTVSFNEVLLLKKKHNHIKFDNHVTSPHGNHFGNRRFS